MDDHESADESEPEMEPESRAKGKRKQKKKIVPEEAIEDEEGDGDSEAETGAEIGDEDGAGADTEAEAETDTDAEGTESEPESAAAVGADEPQHPAIPPETREHIIVAPEHRRTSHVLGRMEMTELISIRASDIAATGRAMIPIPPGVSDPIEIARLELAARKTPLILRRPVGTLRNGPGGRPITYIELWSPNEMTHSMPI